MGLINLMRRYYWVSALFIGLTLIYLGFTLLPAADRQTLTHYHLQAGQLRWLQITIALPYIAIWGAALAGYVRLRYYSDHINNSKDGRAFSIICKGLLALSLWLPLSGALGAIFRFIYARHPATTEALIIFTNYFGIAILATAFVLLDLGAKRFANVTRSVKNAPNDSLIMGYLAFGAFYTWLALSDPLRHFATHDVNATYYSSDWIIVLTIIIPRLIMWFLGMQAIQNIYFYRRKVKGLIYKSSLYRLSAGLGLVVAVSIILGSVQSLMTQVERLGLGSILLIIYVLLIAVGWGYYLIATGSKNLLRIETS